MRHPILIAFSLLLAACGVRLDLERDILDGANYDALKAYLEQCNAFRDEQEYILKF